VIALILSAVEIYRGFKNREHSKNMIYQFVLLLIWLIEIRLVRAIWNSCKDKENQLIRDYLGWYSFFYIISIYITYYLYSHCKIKVGMKWFWYEFWFSIVIWLVYSCVHVNFSNKLRNALEKGCIEYFVFG
jgi:hypothetical protein